MIIYTQEYLEECLRKAYSYESRTGWDAEDLETVFIGTVLHGKRIYDVYMDSSGKYWYKVRIITDKGAVTEYEAVFGKPNRRKHRMMKGK